MKTKETLLGIAAGCILALIIMSLLSPGRSAAESNDFTALLSRLAEQKTKVAVYTVSDRGQGNESSAAWGVTITELGSDYFCVSDGGCFSIRAVTHITQQPS